MEDREVARIGSRLERALRAFDDVPVIELTQLRSRRRRSGWDLAAPAVLVGALLVAVGVSAARVADLTSGAATASAPVPVAPALSAAYGMLARVGDGKSSSVAIVDELGAAIAGPFEGLVAARTSPDGRSIALLLAGSQGTELRIFDGAQRTLGPALLTTAEEFDRTGSALVWADDSSGVLVVSAPRPRVEDAVLATLRVVARDGSVRTIATHRAFSLSPLAWSRGSGVILLSTSANNSGNPVTLVRISDANGAVLGEHVSADPIVTANDRAQLIVTSGACGVQPPCRSLTVRDAVSFAPVSEIVLPPLASTMTLWGTTFLPLGTDLVAWFSRDMNPTAGTFSLVIAADGGRGGRRELGDLRIEAVEGGKIFPPTLIARGDGSAVLFIHPTSSSDAVFSGALVDPASTGRSEVKVPRAIATVVLGQAR